MLENNSMQFSNPTPDWSQFQAGNSGGYNAWKDSTKDAWASWANMYYPNMFQAAMLNYQNEYEKPLNQMLRYQEAGLNPYQYQHTQSASGSQGSSPNYRPQMQQLHQDKIATTLKGIQTMSDVAKTANQIYDYISYGRDKSFLEKGILQNQHRITGFQADSAAVDALWNEYWNAGLDVKYGDSKVPISRSPRALYMKSSTDRINAQITQLSYLVDYLYPTQAAQNQARTALIEYQRQIQHGQYDAVLNLDTGDSTADAVLRYLLFLIGGSLRISL